MYLWWMDASTIYLSIHPSIHAGETFKFLTFKDIFWKSVSCRLFAESSGKMQFACLLWIFKIEGPNYTWQRYAWVTWPLNSNINCISLLSWACSMSLRPLSDHSVGKKTTSSLNSDATSQITEQNLIFSLVLAARLYARSAIILWRVTYSSNRLLI